MEGYGNENPGAFQPTRPLRGATLGASFCGKDTRFQPTRPLRGATELLPYIDRGCRFQPTRPLRGATSRRRDRGQRTIISTHAPLAGRDCKGLCQAPSHYPFQPTRPLRGATFSPRSGEKMDRYFNPRAPCGARLRQRPHPQAGNDISTHAPLAGRDEHRVDHLVRQLDFNPRAPCGARRCVVASNSAYADFNPRAPCGARPEEQFRRLLLLLFQPTRPLRGATATTTSSVVHALFQPTRPLRGATPPRAL